MPRYILTSCCFVFVCLFPALTAAQDHQVWTQVTAQGRLSENWRSHIEVQPRWMDDASELGLVIMRTAIGRQITPHLTVWGGYVFEPRTLGPGVRYEQRIWEQLSIAPPTVGGWKPSGRIRLEQRWQDVLWENTSHRLRFQGRMQRPLAAKSPWQFATYDEVMVTLDETRLGPRQGFDRNRVYGGIMRSINSSLTLEAGYIWEHSTLTATASRNDHILSTVVTVQWPKLTN